MIDFLPRRIRKPLFVFYALMTRTMTLGVRAIVVDEKKRVLLLRHTYVPGWHLPGGGVERGETFEQAIVKELMEEASITLKSKPRYFHTYINPAASRFDHVALYICDNWEQGDWKPDREIAEVGFFHLDNLPTKTTKHTRDRLAEMFAGVEIDDVW